MCVSRLRAWFQGLQIQWLSSPLGAEWLDGRDRGQPPRHVSPGLGQQRDPSLLQGRSEAGPRGVKEVSAGAKGAVPWVRPRPCSSRGSQLHRPLGAVGWGAPTVSPVAGSS